MKRTIASFIAITALIVLSLACGSQTVTPSVVSTAPSTLTVSDAIVISSFTPASLTPIPTATPKSKATPLPLTQEPSSTAISPSLCTQLRFGEHLGPDSIDEFINEGVLFHNVSEIAVRFDCPSAEPTQITWNWKRNGELHCTKEFISQECDRSWLTSWDRSPGNFLITLFSKDGYLGDLQSGIYELIIFISGREAIQGTIEIMNE